LRVSLSALSRARITVRRGSAAGTLTSRRPVARVQPADRASIAGFLLFTATRPARRIEDEKRREAKTRRNDVRVDIHESRTVPLFPLFLKLDGRPVLVVGAGTVAASKLASLAEAGAEVTVVAPAMADPVVRSGVRLMRRRFRPSDVDGAWLVIAAATPAVNRAVARACARRRVFVNAVDDPANASAYLGGVLRRGGATIAISTSGRAPALAGLLREGLDALLPADLDRWFRRADTLKRRWRTRGVPMTARRPELAAAIAQLYAKKEKTR